MFLNEIPTDWGQGNDPVGNAYSRMDYREEKGFHQFLKLQGQPYNEDEVNAIQQNILRKLRRHIFDFMGDGSTRENLGFKVVGEGNPNSILIKGGVDSYGAGNPLRDAGRIFVDGYDVLMFNDDRATFAEKIGDQTYAQLVSAGLASPASLTTPVGSDRIDEVYLEFQLDEIDEAEDTDLINPALNQRTMRAAKLAWTVKVAEGGVMPDTEYDAVAKLWVYRYLLARIQCYDGQDEINAVDVEDLRQNRWWREHDEFGRHLLNVPGFAFQFFQNIVRSNLFGLDGNWHIKYQYDGTTGYILRWKITDDGVNADNYRGEGTFTYDADGNIDTATAWFGDTYGAEGSTAVKKTASYTYNSDNNIESIAVESVQEDHTFFAAPYDF